jgi:catechol 2,3-dioxygenase-like lactoylglutathione lyase family enzyme
MPATRIQIVIDCADADRMVEFWSAATGFVPEDVDGFVRGLVDAGHAPAELTVERPDGKLRWKGYGSLRHPDDDVDERGIGTGRRILFQEVPEPKTVKDRIHLDLLVGAEQREAEVERLVGLGATVLAEVEEHGTHHTTMADPEGNEFCVA